MKVLELFAGSRSVGKVATAMGMEVFSVDIHPFEDVDLAKDIEMLAPADIPFTPDIIWASPPCTTYSMAAISHHRDGTRPKTPFAEKSDRLLRNTLAIIAAFPKAKFFIENPRAMMGKMPELAAVERATVWYCQYGDFRAKPTHIFTNNLVDVFNPYGWTPRPVCRNGNINCHHEAAPRGAKTGTQGIKGAYDRSRVPSELVREVLESVAPKFGGTGTEHVTTAAANHQAPGEAT